MVGYNHSMEWTWNPYGLVHMEWTWNPYGLVHMEWTWNPYGPVHMEWTWNPYGMEMESIWNGSFHVHSMSIPYGFHSAYGMRNGWGLSQSHSIWIPWNGHGIHMD